MLQGSLSGIKVVDFTQIGAGPTCTMYLADLGADVVKLESLSGDIGRGLGPPWIGDDSAIHVAFNRNKRSIAVDLKSEGGGDVARRLVRGADVVVESFRPGVMTRLGLGYDEVARENPAVVYCSVSGYGQTGPCASKAGVDGILQANTGLMALIGQDDDPRPCKVQAPIIDVGTGWIATIGVLSALLARAKSGRGTHLDVSLFASGIALQQSSLTAYLSGRALPEKMGSGAPYSAPNEAFRTRDGHIMVAAYTPDRWDALRRVLGHPAALEDPAFATGADRVLNRAALRAALDECFCSASTQDWLARLEAVDILCSPIADYASVEANPQFRHAGLAAAMFDHDGQATGVRVPAFPVKDDGPALTYRRPPRLGEDTVEVLEALGYTDEEVRALLASATCASP